MPVSPARAAAFDILLRIEGTDAYASELLHAQRYKQLSPADHALLVELVMGVLRWRSVLDERISGYSREMIGRMDAEVRNALRLGAYQLGFLDRVPAYAAISESVELVKRARKRSAAAMVNAVLRRLAESKTESRPPGTGDARALAKALAHPEWLVERWWKAFGAEAAEAICRYDQQQPAAAIRLRDPDSEADLTAAGVKLAPGVLLREARRVVSGDITRSKAFSEGRVAIQDEASQLVAALVAGERILDCCAAPGGKTALLADANPAARILATELHPHRARLLRSRVRSPNVEVIAADAGNRAWSMKFDAVLADVPCSGTGTLARNPEIKWRLRPEDLGDLQQRQARILRSAVEQLAPGGEVVYATCSLEQEENEAVVEAVMAHHAGVRLISCKGRLERLRELGILAWQDLEAITRGPYLRTIPGMQPCDGFFAAILTNG
jgi:16S rRNA (cytosine967-C5)-methyltransferase